MLNIKRNLISTAVLAATLGLTACGGSDSSDNDSNKDPISNNQAPSDLMLKTTHTVEAQAGSIVGTINVADMDSNDSFTYTLSDDRFEISVEGSTGTLQLKSGESLDYSTDGDIDLEITVTDSAGDSYTETFEINVTPSSYNFDSQFTAGSSVSYSGQVSRQLLINDLTLFINDELTDTSAFDTKQTFADRAAVLAELKSYFDVSDYDSLSARNLLTTTTPVAEQLTLNDVSSSSKNLVGKIAGNDAVGQYKDWTTQFVGIDAKGSTTPEDLVNTWFDELADNASDQLDGTVRTDVLGNSITNISLTADGRDLKQLIQKFLLMSVGYSQAADDYLDDDTAGKGLLSDHTDGGKAYSALEHQFDEGFGYFGAARDYLAYTDAQLAAKAYYDHDNSGTIDFNSEYNFGQSINAVKRDIGSTVATDFSQDAMTAFLKGRKLLNDTAGTALTDAQMEELKIYRDEALTAWENAISSTIIHYINKTHSDLSALGTDTFNFSDTAKHWSELKGFGLGLQFNRFSPLNEAKFAEFHQLIGDKPVLTGDSEVSAYKADLIKARDILQAAYNFDAQNVENW